MKLKTEKTQRLPALVGAVGMMVLGAGYSLSANASCAMAPQQGEWQKPSALLGTTTDRATVAALIAQDLENLGGGPEGIVGVWKFQFISEGNTAAPLGIPDGAQLDAGHVTWHSDHSELMNSGRAPIIGDFCMGLWQKVGHSTYKLNHFASNWVIDPSVPTYGEMSTGPTIIRETVTVAHDDNSYAGEFSITNYKPDAKTVLGPIITGVVYGRRETLTSTD